MIYTYIICSLTLNMFAVLFVVILVSSSLLETSVLPKRACDNIAMKMIQHNSCVSDKTIIVFRAYVHAAIQRRIVNMMLL